MILVSGSYGESSPEIAKFAVKYCSNRNKFKDGAYEIETGTRKSS